MIRNYQLSRSALDLLAAGGSDAAVLDLLHEAQLSKHLLLIRELAHVARTTWQGEYAAVGVAESIERLSELQEQAPGDARAVLSSAQVGAWAMYCLRRMHGTISGPVPLEVDLAHLGNIVAAVALRAGRDFQLSVAVRNSAVMLPTAGRALFDIGADPRIAHARGGDELTVVGFGRTGWLELRRLSAECDGLTLSVDLDDLDPYRGSHGHPVADRLTPAEFARWRALFTDAWRLLVRRHPPRARELTGVVKSLVPVIGGTSDEGVSATSRDAFGAIALTCPAHGDTLAETLVHESQHAKLSALLDLVELYDVTDRRRIHYAPWRSDPRPLGGLLQGVYAFLAVAEFWRVQLLADEARPNPKARFEYFRVVAQLRCAMRALEDSASLTELGRAFAARMHATVDSWADDACPPDELALVRDAVADNRILWRLRNLDVDDDAVARLAEAWLAKQRCTIQAAVTPIESRAAFTGHRRLELAHLRCTDRGRFDRMHSEPAALHADYPHATSADLLLVDQDYTAAGQRFLDQVQADPDRLESWAGLALVRSRTGGPAVWFDRPELVRAVYLAARARTAETAGIDHLANWLLPAGGGSDASSPNQVGEGSISQSARRSAAAPITSG